MSEKRRRLRNKSEKAERGAEEPTNSTQKRNGNHQNRTEEEKRRSGSRMRKQARKENERS